MDMQALSNKYGMPIKIFSIKDFNDPSPKVETMQPDGDFEVDQLIDEMILLNTGSYHFDLIRKIKTNEAEVIEIRQSKSEETKENNLNVKFNFAEKSEKEEIKDLKVIVQQMKEEINKLK